MPNTVSLRNIIHGYAEAQETLSLGQRFQSFIGCSHHLIRISFSDLTLVVDNRYREETRPVEVDIGIEKVTVILVERFGAGLWDISIAQMLAHH